MKRLTFLALALLTTATFGRDWTSTEGKTIQADLVEVKGAAGNEIAVLKMANGATFEVPLARLSAADQTFAKTAATSKPAAVAEAGAPSIFKDVLKGKLVAVDGKRVGKYEMTAEPKYYAFYFSAHWCPPCRTFTPKLVEFYNSSEGKKKDFEIIFVTNDNDEKSMEEYMLGDQMPWPAIAYRSAERIKEVQKYAGNGIPCLVLVDREGKVLSHSYEGANYVGPSKVMRDIPTMTKPQ